MKYVKAKLELTLCPVCCKISCLILSFQEKLFLTKKNLLKQLSDLRPENDIHNTERTISPEIDVTEMDSDKLVINFKVSHLGKSVTYAGFKMPVMKITSCKYNLNVRAC